MSKSTYGVRRAGLASIATMSLVTAAAVAGAGAASATTDFKFKRIGGADRYETSTLVADEFATTNPSVILANGEPGNYADALSANTLAGEKNIPVLLTRKDKTPASVLTQLQEDGTKNITVVGGESVVSAAQVAALTAAGYTVTRIAGDDRFATNADIIAASGAAAGATGLIATGFNFPDALAAGPVSFQGHPLGLSTTNSIDDEVVAALKAAGVTKVLIFGGTSAVSAAVEAKLAANGITVASRFAGTDRADTSALAAEYAVKNLGFTNTHVGVASGYVKGYGADALAGGPLEGKEKSPMLVTRDVNVPGASVLTYLKNHAATLKDGHLYGGTAAISAAAQAEMEKAAQTVTSNQDFSVTPADAVTLAQADEAGATPNADNRSYTISGLDANTTYSIGLVNGDNVTVSSGGVVSFKDTEGTTSTTDDNGLADNLGSTATDAGLAADIVTLNGNTVNVVFTTTKPVNGAISFTIDGDAAGSVVPVIWVDANGNSQLDLNAANEPTEDFGIGGKTTYTAPAAGAGATGGAVTAVDKTANTFTANNALYTYDTNDLYNIVGVGGVDQATFEAALSSGDSVAVANYSPNSAGVSVFTLTDSNPSTPTTTATTNSGVVTDDDSNDITVTVTGTTVTAGEYDSVVIQRAVYNAATTTRNWVAVATVAKADDADKDTTDGDFNYVDRNVADGTYVYRSALINDGDQSAFSDESGQAIASAPSSDSSAPTAVDTRLETNGGNPLLIESGDSFQVAFSEPIAAPAANATVRVTDEDGSVYFLTNGAGVTFTREGAATTVGGVEYPANTVLTVDITTLPTAATVGTVAGLGIPATITQQSGITDLNSNAWNVAGSADVVIDSL